jgi:pyruvate carboxylase
MEIHTPSILVIGGPANLQFCSCADSHYTRAKYGFNTDSGLWQPGNATTVHQADGGKPIGNRHSHFPGSNRPGIAHRSDLRAGRSIWHPSVQSRRSVPDRGRQGARSPLTSTIDGIVAIAKETGVQAIHPGYGFLSENPQFARACAQAGIIFVGPRPELLEMMGDKTTARALARKIGVPTLAGTEQAVTDRAEALKVARELGFPLIIKAAFGGGGRGMRVVHKGVELARLVDEAQTEADRAFGNPAVFLEKYVPHAKHIEVQIVGDQHGSVIHLHERDCSVQRRHQKVVEVAPSYGLPSSVIKELCDAAVRIAREIRYDNAGTIEFLYDLDRHEWFFIEMNPESRSSTR